MNHVISLFLFAFLLVIKPVQAIEPLTVTAKQLWSQAKQVHHIKIKGGLPPIYWQTKAGEVDRGSKPNTFIYTAPKRYMQDEIRFFDRAGQEITVIIDILRPLSVSPKIRHIPQHGEVKFNISGGSGQWQIRTAMSNKVKKLNKMTLIVQVGELTGLQTLTVFDKVTGEQFAIQVQIYAPLDIE